jgi:hypothetical protein
VQRFDGNLASLLVLSKQEHYRRRYQRDDYTDGSSVCGSLRGGRLGRLGAREGARGIECLGGGAKIGAFCRRAAHVRGVRQASGEALQCGTVAGFIDLRYEAIFFAGREVGGVALEARHAIRELLHVTVLLPTGTAGIPAAVPLGLLRTFAAGLRVGAVVTCGVPSRSTEFRPVRQRTP